MNLFKLIFDAVEVGVKILCDIDVMNMMCLGVRAHNKSECCCCFFQKYEKPKFVQCLAFLNNGDILTGDSGGVLLIWTRSTADPPPGKGLKGIAFSMSL